MRDGHLHRTTMRLRQETQFGRAEPFRPLVGHEKRTQCTKMQIFKSFRQPEVGVWCAEREDVDANRAIAVDSGTDFRSELTQMLGTLRDRRTDRYLNRKQSKKQRHYSVWAREGTAEAKNRQRSTQGHRDQKQTQSDSATDTDRSPLGGCGALENNGIGIDTDIGTINILQTNHFFISSNKGERAHRGNGSVHILSRDDQHMFVEQYGGRNCNNALSDKQYNVDIAIYFTQCLGCHPRCRCRSG